MLLYSNRGYIRILYELQGSVIYKTNHFLAGAILAAFCAIFQNFIERESELAPMLAHFYAMSTFGTILSFAIVFRTNLAWYRYWEGLTEVTNMYRRWEDAHSAFTVFTRCSINIGLAAGDTASMAKVYRLRSGLRHVGRHFALLSALATWRLAHGDTERMDKRHHRWAPWRDQIVFESDFPSFQEMPDLVYGSEPGSLSVVAVGSTDPTSWRKSVDRPSTASGDHSPSLEARVSHLCPSEEVELLAKSTNRVRLALVWLLCTLAQLSKDLDVAPPIQSRVYQMMSDGMSAYCQAEKIADVPFPFPYAQVLGLAVLVFSVFLPVYVACFTQATVAGPVMTFVIFQIMWGVNEVAIELENPFGKDVNDVALGDYHAHFADSISQTVEVLGAYDASSEAGESKDYPALGSTIIL